MNEYLPIAVDIVAITILVFGIYFPRHRRTDMALAYMTVNIGVLAVADTLAASAVAAGLGLGLFGVLSIIRLRSEELTQREVAYYFAARHRPDRRPCRCLAEADWAHCADPHCYRNC